METLGSRPTVFRKVADRLPHRDPVNTVNKILLHRTLGSARLSGVRQARTNINQGRGTTVAPLKSTIKRTARLAAVGVVLLVSALAAISLLLHHGPAVSESPNSEPRPPSGSAPRTLPEVLALKANKLEGTDIALMSLLCAEGLPGAEDLNVSERLAGLYQWVQHAKSAPQFSS
jgi:hypothetical protein